jgi:hypothetical protein
MGPCLDGHPPGPIIGLSNGPGLPSFSPSLCLNPPGLLPSKRRPLQECGAGLREERETSGTEASRMTEAMG